MHSISHTPPVPLYQFSTKQDPLHSAIGNELTETAGDWIESALHVQGAYVHVPFCFHKCHYCDFYSIVGDSEGQTAFVNRLVGEIEFVGTHMNSPLSTIFIGGGTPTLLEGPLLTKMLECIASNLPMSNDVEWTVEANPETVTSDTAARLAGAGVNRISIGSQSFNEDCLTALERWQEPSSVQRSVEHLRTGGIENINIDLIFAIPNQTLEIVHDDLLKAIALEPKHISSYSLTYEPNTPLAIKERRGDIRKAEEDLEARMYEETISVLATHGFEQYEISNYAKPGKTCKHNLLYWNNGFWWPFGPGAAGHVSGRRWRNVPRLSQYIRGKGLSSVEDVELLSPSGQAGEALMMGLRLLNGMVRERIEELLDVEAGSWRAGVIAKQIENGMLRWRNDHLCLTSRGLMFGDTVVGALLKEESSIADTSEQVSSV